MWLPDLVSSSSNVTTSRLLCVSAHCTYPLRCALSQLSAAVRLPSWASSLRFGMTNETVGSVAKSVGKRVKRRFVLGGRLAKFTQGLCLRAYLPLVQPVNPSDGRDSEYPAKLSFAVRSCAPRLPPVNVCGQESLVR